MAFIEDACCQDWALWSATTWFREENMNPAMHHNVVTNRLMLDPLTFDGSRQLCGDVPERRAVEAIGCIGGDESTEETRIVSVRSQNFLQLYCLNAAASRAPP